jgi:hypothetical protein
LSHPSPQALLELHFLEAEDQERVELLGHVRSCTACSAYVDGLVQLERALSPDMFSAPPADGLARVLARVEAVSLRRARRAEWALAAVPSALAVAMGSWAVRSGGERLTALGLIEPTASGLVPAELLGASLAALGLVVVGALVTLALAPVLILESRGRT